MDTSEIYIKMCDCEEIQGQAPKNLEGEFAYHRGDAYRGAGQCGEWQSEARDTFIWLPDQARLQEMSGFDWRSFDRKCLVYESTDIVPTKEQAGIRVVMKENHNKVWDGSKWENTDKRG